MVCTDIVARCFLRPYRTETRRSSGHGPAELRGGRHAALGLPTGRHCHHAGQLARQRRRARLLHRGFRGTRDRLPGRFRAGCGRIEARAGFAANPFGRPRDGRRIQSRPHGRRARDRGDTPRQRRSLVDHALYIRNHVAAEGRAAASSRRAGCRHCACRAKSLPARRTDARRDAALSHHGRALADSDVADRRHIRLSAAL